eukprot:400768_1
MLSPSISNARKFSQRLSIVTPPSYPGGYLAFIGLLFQITLGLLWTYGNVLPYIASYIAYHSTNKETVTSTDYNHYTSIVNYSFFLLFTSLTFGAIIGGKVEIYFGPTISMLISSTFVSIGFGATSIALWWNNVYLVLFTYGVLFGTGIGLGYPILVIIAMRWFPNHQGRVCGIISAVFGGSPLIWDTVQEVLVNPNDYKMDDDIGYCRQHDVIKRIPYMFAYIAAISVIMQFISLLFVKNPKWYITEREKNNSKNEIYDPECDLHDEYDQDGLDNFERSLLENTQKTSQQDIYEKNSLTVQQSVRTTTFWVFWINNFIYSYVLMFVAAEWKEFGNSYLKLTNGDYLAIMGSLGALCNGIGRFCWGFFYDYNRSFKITMGVQTFIVGLFVGTLPLIKYIPMFDLQINFAFWICIIWACVGCQYGFLPTCVASTFGAKYTGSIVGLFIWCEAPASLLVVVATQYKKQIFGGWFVYTIFMGCCAFMSTILSILTKEKLDRQKIFDSYNKRKESLVDLPRFISTDNTIN